VTGILLRTVPVRSRRQFVVDLAAIARPWFWPVSLVPYYLGFLLATHHLFPAGGQWWRVLVAAFVVEPLVWLAVLAINDAHDLPGDLVNPRKAGTPMVSGRLSADAVRRIAYLAGAVALLVSLAVGPEFAVGAALALGLGLLYSAPPVRLKARPGADVVANALAIGALGPLAGWTTVHSFHGYPWVLTVQGMLIGAALYIPTTLTDYRADLATGYRTVAVRLGPRVTYRVGFACWVVAAGMSIWLSAVDLVIPRRMLLFELVTEPLLILAYHALLSRRQSIHRIAVISFLFGVPSVVFAAIYAGIV
jgi:chlorophyll synthase